MAKARAIKVRTEAFLTDLHLPDIDKACWKLTLDIVKTSQPDLIWLNGDFLDFKSVSRFLTEPSERFKLHQCLIDARRVLCNLREIVPNARIIFRSGNHDRRLQNYIIEKAPELSFLEELQLPNLLQLKAVDCEFKAGDDRTQVGHLFHIHGDEIPTGRIFPARMALSRLHDNVIFGHVHRFSVAYEAGIAGHNHVAWSIGTLQNLKVDYSFHPEWQQGVAWIDYNPSGLFNISPVPFFVDGGKKHCFVNGKHFSA